MGATLIDRQSGPLTEADIAAAGDLRYASVNTVQAFTDAQKLQAIANLGIPHECGRLTYVSATAIKFAPFKGDLLKINGSVYRIPAAGIAGVANTSVYVGGVAAQNLAASTVYYVYAFSNAGVVTADFRTGAHSASATAGNIGTEILTGDDTRSLVGMVCTNASSQFTDDAANRCVLSWFNRRSISGQAAFTADRTTTSAPFVELNTEIRVRWLTWADESVELKAVGTVSVNTINAIVTTSIGIDSTTVAEDCFSRAMTYGSTALVSVGATMSKNGVTEGVHFSTLLAGVSAATGTWPGSGTAGSRCTHHVTIRG